MSSELLREAADRLDALTLGALDTEGMEPWYIGTEVTDLSGGRVRPEDAAYIAAMSPTVGKALAAWLREAAMRREVGSDYSDHALATANAVLGRDA